MNNKQRRTLCEMFEKPTPARIRWADIESMLKAAGVEVTERKGSRVLLRKGADRMVVHRPHPQPEIHRVTVRKIAEFLDALEVRE